MKRTLKLERLYSLGDYKNIKFIDEITDLPEEISNNEDAINLLRSLQFVGIDKAHQQYMHMHMSKGMKGATPEEAIIELDKIKDYLIYELEKTITNGNTTD